MSHFHPELSRSAALFRFFPPLSVLRWLTRRVGVRQPPKLRDLEVHDETITARDGQPLRVRVYRPADASRGPGLLWIHGGGYVMGAPEFHEHATLELVRKLGVTVVAVSYRVAPEWPFPTPLEDCYSALRWLRDHAGELGVDVGRLAVGGASAGGGLAAALAQLAHDRGEVPLVFQLLIYPMLDDRSAVSAEIDLGKLRLWSQDDNRFGWTSYLGHAPGAAEVAPYAVPARRERLDGLPPAWIGTGDCDLFCAEDVAYAQRLTASGVDCKLVVVPGAYHGFDIVKPNTRVSASFRADYTAALAHALR